MVVVRDKLFFSQLYSTLKTSLLVTKCEGVFPVPSRTLTRAKCPKISFNLDTLYLELVSDPTG